MNRRMMLGTLIALPTFPVFAGLEVGALAPEFTLQAVKGGDVYRFSLREALAEGPVVLYFFPAAFSEGCSIEAHTFAESIEGFRSAGATVLGVSSDDIATLTNFSKQACQGKFPVASDSNQHVIKSYDAVMQTRPEYATRVSFVIAQDRRIAYTYKNLEPTKHVARTLDAVRQLPKTATLK
jgi:thioredoxin-dependent peroxiredoxin